ncbi:hypothetical protein Pcinc_000591 [Petrolisthes cinctipes]|uniref:Uncharacterized protein n=1 Tax=Petrolisthes cinctipes TaxID=88211 RepID=A0AAE1GS09_PETCI|nr:hypothetical protein Pcinc_000591 [Petrolisthes cinctipes]
MASPMRLVFTILTDEEGLERVMSIGDMSLLAIWIKLLHTDLANFSILGDSKILNKLDCNTNALHKDGVKPPKEVEQLNFLKMTTLQDRKVAASLHGQVNARTRTHIGQVTSASWAIDAICTITKGDTI